MICKTQAKKSPQIAWIEAVCQDLRKGSRQGELVLAVWRAACVDVWPRVPVGCSWAWARLCSKGTADPGGCISLPSTPFPG